MDLFEAMDVVSRALDFPQEINVAELEEARRVVRINSGWLQEPTVPQVLLGQPE